MKTVLAAALLAATAATGCATINPAYYQNVSTAEICRGLLTLPSYNVNHPARMAELQRRGESCGSPADLAAAQRANDARFQQAVTPPPAAPAPPAPVVCTDIGGGKVVCR